MGFAQLHLVASDQVHTEFVNLLSQWLVEPGVDELGTEANNRLCNLVQIGVRATAMHCTSIHSCKKICRRSPRPVAVSKGGCSRHSCLPRCTLCWALVPASSVLPCGAEGGADAGGAAELQVDEDAGERPHRAGHAAGRLAQDPGAHPCGARFRARLLLCCGVCSGCKTHEQVGMRVANTGRPASPAGFVSCVGASGLRVWLRRISYG